MKTTCILAPIAAAALILAPATAQDNFSTLLTFTDAAPGPLTPANGTLYGVSAGPGASCGTVFQVNPPSAPGQPWTQTVLYSFAAANDVCDPGPVAYAGGNLYGLAPLGGANGFGGFFELQPPSAPGGAWTETVLYNFLGSPLPEGYVLLGGPGGSFYLPVSAYPYGALAQFQPPTAPGGSWTLAEIYSYPEEPGGGADLIYGPGGVLYGTSLGGNASYRVLGKVVQLTPPAAPGQSWTDTLLFRFGPAHEDNFIAGPTWLTLGSGGVLYGTVVGYEVYVGVQPQGGVYSLAPPASPGGAWTYTLLEDFGRYHPCTPLTLYKGILYGGVANAGYTSGAIFKLAPPSAPGGEWTLTYLHEFTGQVPDGALVVGGDGALYGASTGQNGGTVFRIAVE